MTLNLTKINESGIMLMLVKNTAVYANNKEKCLVAHGKVRNFASSISERAIDIG
jgi:hypothetical protein